MTQPDEGGWTSITVLVPHFRLPSTRGRDLGPTDFKHRRNLILVFLHKAECVQCRALLRTLADHYPNLRALEAEILFIVGGEKTAAETLYSQMHLPFPFLFDVEDRGLALCLGAESVRRPAILIVDRYGALWSRLLTHGEDGQIDVQEVIDKLQFIELQCPECGVPDEPSSV